MGKQNGNQGRELQEKLINENNGQIDDINKNNKIHQQKVKQNQQESKMDKYQQDQNEIEEQKVFSKSPNSSSQNNSVYQQNQSYDMNQNQDKLQYSTKSPQINFNIPSYNDKETPKGENVFAQSSLGGSNDIYREGSMVEVNLLKLQNSRVSYQDLDELHEDLLDEREQDDKNEGRGFFSRMCHCFRRKQNHSDNWLKHFKLLVKNTRFIENSWSGGLFNLINNRFSNYKNIDSEELYQNAQNTLDDNKLKRENSNGTINRSIVENRSISNRTIQEDKLNDSQDGVAKDLKQVIQNSVILEEDVESLRESLRHEQMLAHFEQSDHSSFIEQMQSNSINNLESLQARKYSLTMKKDDKESKLTQQRAESASNGASVSSNYKSSQLHKKIDSNQKKEINQKMEKIGRSIDIVAQQSDQKHPKVKVESKYQNRIRSSSLKKKNMQSSGSSVINQGNDDSRFEDSQIGEEVYDDALGKINKTIKTNTLLINSEVLQEKDFELYQAVVYYKTITFVIEQHLNEDNNFTQEKPLRVIRDNFIEFYVRQYGKNLQRLEEDQIIESIQSLKEFLTLYLEVIREYYKLDDLVDKCLYADRFITTDNLINFLCSLLFQDDAVYSIIYVSHCHFEPKLSLKYFKNVKALCQQIELDVLKVNEEYCLNQKTLLKLQKKMDKKNCSINDSNILKGYSFKQPYQKAFEHLKTIGHQRSPVHKLKVIIKTQDLINECIKDFYDYFKLDYTDIYYDADNLVGIFSYILIKSEVYDIISHCKIIENFATKNTLNSHSGYLLVTLQCCIRFISTINVPVLLNQNILELNKL